jgi:zinc protease
MMSIELKGMDRLDEALEFVWKGARSAHRGFADVTWQQFDAQKKIAQASFIAGLEPLVSRTNQIGEAVQFSKDVEFGSTQEYLIYELKKYESFDGEAIASTVKRTLDPDKAKVIIIKANKEGIKGDKRVAMKFQTKSHDKAQEPEVDPKEAKRPLTVKAELKALDNAIRYELGNGMKVVLLPVEGAMPLVAADLIFDVGDVHAPTPGLADAAARFLQLPLDAEAMAMTGVGVNGGTNNDHTFFSSRAVNIYLDVVINALERTITAGEYYQEQIEGWQKRTREYMKLHSVQEELEFQRQILAGVFGGEHPYTKNGLVLPDSIGGIGKDALNSFRRKHYTAGNATLVIAGNFDPEKAKRYISSAFGGWSKGHVDTAMSEPAAKAAGAQFVGVVAEREGPQMTVAIAYPAPAGVDGEEAARMVLTEMLNSRMGDIRFKLGSTYGVYARRTRNVGPSSYEMGGTVDAARAGESLAAMRDGVEQLRQGGDQFDIDFVRARRSLIQQLLGESTVSAELAARLGTIARYDLGADYYDKLLKTIAAVPVAQVKALIARELDPSREVVVCLADRATVEKAFVDAGMTNVKIVEPTYK